jgi:hypothetical protein
MDNCYPYLSESYQDNNFTSEKEISQCSDACAQYLQLFANLFQFYLLSIFIMYVHKYFRSAALSLIILSIVISTYITFQIIQEFRIKAYLFYDSSKYMRYLEHRPWFRLPSFLFGMLFGLVISRIHSARYIVNISLPK